MGAPSFGASGVKTGVGEDDLLLVFEALVVFLSVGLLAAIVVSLLAPGSLSMKIARVATEFGRSAGSMPG